MKQSFLKFLISGICIAIAGSASAQIDNLVNLSPEWVRSGARNTATDGVDAAVYNPAGITALTPGLHISVANQSLFRSPEHHYNLGMGDGPQSASQDGADWLVPSLYVSLNQGKTAFYTGYCLSGGGATANYTGGSINTDMVALQALMAAQGAYGTTSDQYFKASSAYHTVIAGASYSLNEKLSFGITTRYVMAKNTAKAGLTLTGSPYDYPDMPMALESEETANGAGYTLSMLVSPTENFKVAVRYESKVNLDFKNKTVTDDFGLTTDGSKTARDLPACIATGVEVKVSPRVRMMADYNLYLQSDADWGTGYVNGGEKDYSYLAGNAEMFGFGVEYALSARIKASLGGTYTNFNYNDKDGYFTKPGAFETLIDDNYSINTGFTYSMNKMVDFTFGYMVNVFQKDEVKALNAYPLDVTVTTENKMSTLALGVNLTF